MRAKEAGPYGGPICANYPQNEWWVAANSGEVSRKPMQRWILDRPVVLYRKQDGGVVALDDRCLHRWAPLSKGWVEGDNIVCGYHGFEYCPAGDCVKVPSQERPVQAAVQSYPVFERAPLVWIWTGDPARCKERAPPAFPWLGGEGWNGANGHTEVAANYLLMKENVLDLSHVGYVHRATFGPRGWKRAPEVTAENGEVTFVMDHGLSKTSLLTEIAGFGDRPATQRDWGRHISPAVMEAGSDFTDPEAKPGMRAKGAVRFLHATTPISPTRSHYFWFVWAHAAFRDDQINALTGILNAAFEEDKRMLSAVQEMIERDPRGVDYPELIVGTDKAAILGRKLTLKRAAEDAEPGEAPRAAQ